MHGVRPTEHQGEVPRYYKEAKYALPSLWSIMQDLKSICSIRTVRQ